MRLCRVNADGLCTRNCEESPENPGLAGLCERAGLVPMEDRMHHWRRGGSEGRYVHHSSDDAGHGTDSIGVGLGEDVLGPFSSARLAGQVADALNNAYRLGWDDNEEEHGSEEFAPPEYDDNDTENPYPRDREDGEGFTRPSYGD